MRLTPKIKRLKFDSISRYMTPILVEDSRTGGTQGQDREEASGKEVVGGDTDQGIKQLYHSDTCGHIQLRV